MKVQDFTKDTELKTGGVHCGRFRMDQVESINRTFRFNPKQVFVVSLLSLVGMAAPLAGQSVRDTTVPEIRNVKKDVLSLTGFVHDRKTDEGIPFANILIKNKHGEVIIGGISNIDGSYSIMVTRDLLEEPEVKVEVSVIGYYTVKYPEFNLYSDSINLNMNLIANEGELIEVIVTGNHSGDPVGTKTFDSEDIRESPYRQ